MCIHHPTRAATSRAPTRPLWRIRWGCLSIASLLASLLLSACGASTLAPAAQATATARAEATGTAQAIATSTAAAQATQAAQPVLVTITASPQGTIADGNLKLVSTTAVTNHTTAAIQLSHQLCQERILVLSVLDAVGKGLWENALWISCPPGEHDSMVDKVTVAAGTTYTEQRTDDLTGSHGLRSPAQMGVPYTVKATLIFWHTGQTHQIAPPAQVGQPQGTNVEGQTTITFQ